MVEEEEVEEAFVVTVTAVEDTVVIKEVVVAVIDIEVDTTHTTTQIAMDMKNRP